MPDNRPICPAATAPAESTATRPVAQSPRERLREITAGIGQGMLSLTLSPK